METFAHLTDDERRRLQEQAQQKTYERGETIVAEGQELDAIFTVRKGSASVEKDYLGQPVPVGELAPGDIFGEMSFLEGKATSASVVALEPVEVDVLEGSDLSKLLSSDPTLAAHFYQSLAVTLAARLRQMDVEAIVGAFSWG